MGSTFNVLSADPDVIMVAPIVALPHAGEATPADAGPLARPRADDPTQFDAYRIKSQLARDLHDEVVQTLTSVMMQVRVFAREQQEQQGDRVVVQQFAYVHSSIRDVLNNLRQILSDLRGQPGFDGDLVEAIKGGLLPRYERTRMRVTLKVGRSWPASLPPMTGIHLYRIVQEALTNAYRHGAARAAQVDLKATANMIVCTVRDDGRGIASLDDSKPLGMGILGMKERAALFGGLLTIRNRRRGGTAVTATFAKEELLWPSKHELSVS